MVVLQSGLLGFSNISYDGGFSGTVRFSDLYSLYFGVPYGSLSEPISLRKFYGAIKPNKKIHLDASILSQPDGTEITTWVGSNDTPSAIGASFQNATKPTFKIINGLNSVNISSTFRQYLYLPSLSFDLQDASNNPINGITIVAVTRRSSTISSYERIFDFGTRVAQNAVNYYDTSTWYSNFTQAGKNTTLMSVTGTAPDQEYVINNGATGITNHIYDTSKSSIYLANRVSITYSLEVNLDGGTTGDYMLVYLGCTAVNAVHGSVSNGISINMNTRPTNRIVSLSGAYLTTVSTTYIWNTGWNLLQISITFNENGSKSVSFELNSTQILTTSTFEPTYLVKGTYFGDYLGIGETNGANRTYLKIRRVKLFVTQYIPTNPSVLSRFSGSANTSRLDLYNSSSSTYIQNFSTPDDNFYVLVLRLSHNSVKNISVFFNGNLSISSTPVFPTLFNRNTIHNYIGRSNWSNDGYTNMDIREIIVMNNTFSDEQVSAISKYMMKKWNILYEYPPVFIGPGNNWTKDLTDTVEGISGEIYAKYQYTVTSSSSLYGFGKYIAYANTILSYFAGTTYFTDEWPPSGAFDKRVAATGAKAGWHSAITTLTSTSDIVTPPIIYLILPNSITVKQYSVQTRGDGYTEQAPSKWSLEGSNDLTSWSIVDTESSVTPWVAKEIKTFDTTNNTQQYRMYRMVIYRNNSTTNQYVAVSDIRLYAPEYT